MTQPPSVVVVIMSGVDDGTTLDCSQENGDGRLEGQRWTLQIGRREDSDICLRHDLFVSRQHACIYWEDDRWWLHDLGSTNGTFIENQDGDTRVSGTIPLPPGALFRVGRTWLRIEPAN